MGQRLANKVAVVTGAGSKSGVGREVVLAMAAEGASVIVNDIVRNPDGSYAADDVVAQIRQAGGKAAADHNTVATLNGAQNIIKSAIDSFGRIDILVNTAGNFIVKPTVDYPESDWVAIMEVHLRGHFGCTQAALREMVKQKSGGRIINFTSTAAFPRWLGPGPAIAYCTAKAGVLGFTKALSLEVKEYGITVNAVAPEARTNLFQIPGRIVEGVQVFGPEYVAPIVVYLATDEAKDITGQVIYSGSGDLIIYAPPLTTPGAHQYLHKEGKWTVEELAEIMPRMLGISA
jgi:NAD(P)-dependent dehydrogenase (short-subunit alcohol dehydrogenase family)